MNSAIHWQRNLVLLNAISFARTFMIIMPIFVPLMQSYGLDMRETMLLQSIFAGVTLLLEVPSGYFADVFGRRNTLIVGYALAGLGFSQVLWANTFLELAIFEVTLGFALSFVSGSDTALAFESEKALGHDNGQPAIARLLSWMNFGEGVAAFCAFVLLKFDVRWVLWVQAIVGWIPFLLGLFLVEPPKLSTTHPSKKTVRKALKLFVNTSVLPILVIVFVLTMSTTYLVAWLNQSLWQAHKLPLENFGLVWGFFSLSVGIAARFSARIPDHVGPFSIFIWLGMLMFLGFLALNSNVLSLILLGGVLISVFRGFAAPKIKIRVNNAIDNDYRATINSLVGASFRIATLILGPLMGFIADQYGAQLAAASLVVLVVPAVFGLFILEAKTQDNQKVVV